MDNIEEIEKSGFGRLRPCGVLGVGGLTFDQRRLVGSRGTNVLYFLEYGDHNYKFP